MKNTEDKLEALRVKADLAQERRALQDRLDDIMEGFEFWKRAKVANIADLSTLDKVLIRWVETGR